jgi:hypothetical protein
MLIEEDKIAVIRAIRQHKGWMVKETVDFVNSHWDKWIKIV